MDDVQRTGRSLSVIDLTNDNASSSNHAAQYSDPTRSDDRGANRTPELIDLTDNDKHHFNFNIPVIDLTEDNDQFLNRRIPVIDLTDDDAQDITHQIQCFDLTYNDAFNGSHTMIQNFNLEKIDDQQINLSTELIDLTHDDIQDSNTNANIIDLTSDNDKLMNYEIQDIDMTNGEVQDIANQLQSFDITNVKQKNVNDCIPTHDLTNDSYQSDDRIIPLTDPASYEDHNSDRMAQTDLTQSDESVVRKPINDAEINDLSSHNVSANSQGDIIENDPRIPITNLCYNVTDKEIEKWNETGNMYVTHFGAFSSTPKLPGRKAISLKNLPNTNFEGSRNNLMNPSPTKNFERKQEILTNYTRTNNSEEKTKATLTSRVSTNNSEERTKGTLTSRTSTNSSEENYFIPVKISQNCPDFLKPASHPIPLRHCLGRSIAGTGQNIPIEFTEGPEGHSSNLTASSLIRRKKSKSMAVVSNHIPTESMKLLTTRENTVSYETFIEIFPKFWISLLLIFIGFLIGFNC